jgi:hypothetical protein
MTPHLQNPYLPHTLRPNAGPAPTKQLPKVTLDHRGLPVGTAAQVMDWVGDDPDRAASFLTKEQQETRPRVSLVANLKAVLKRHDVAVIEIPERTGQLAPQIDVIPAERTAIAEGEPLVGELVDPLALVRERLGVEQP